MFNNGYIKKEVSKIDKKEKQPLPKNADGTYQCIIPFNGNVEPAEYVDELKVYINGVETKNYTLNGGRISLVTSGVVTADYEYYWKVCFGSEIQIIELVPDVFRTSMVLEVVRE